MRPSQYYANIEATLAKDENLKEIPRIQNTYQEELLEKEAMAALKEPGVVICYYFHRTAKGKAGRRGSVHVDGMFTFAVVENVTQHKTWVEANPDVTDYRAKSALEIAEELVAALSASCELTPPGISQEVQFADPILERIQSESGRTQIDVNLLAPCVFVKS